MSFKKIASLVLISLSLTSLEAIAQDQQSQPFKINASHTEILPQEQAVAAPYGAPKMVGMPPVRATVPKPPKPPKPPKQKPITGGINTAAPPAVSRPMAPPQQVVEGVLPPQFLGRWQVLGSRSNVEAQPQYQAGMDSIFSMTTSNMWNIQGSPEQGYMLNTDTGVSTPLMVQTQGNTAILRYQHPIKNTMAQEALVMQLGPGGAQFDGLERISIVKQGEPQPRAKVTYKLIGRRQ